MRILIVGAGSTGGYFGARLVQAGRDVTFLVRPARAAALRANGLRVLSPLGDFAVAPRLAEAATLAETFDVVLVTVKAFGLAAAIEDFAPAVGPGTMILPVLNGMKHVDDLQAALAQRGCARGTHQEGDVASGLRQARAEIAAGRAGADDQDLHGRIPRLQCFRKSIGQRGTGRRAGA